MNNIKNHVLPVPLARELTKALKGVGVELETVGLRLIWRRYFTNDTKLRCHIWGDWRLQIASFGNDNYAQESVPAYMLTELLELLPDYIVITESVQRSMMSKTETNDNCYYLTIEGGPSGTIGYYNINTLYSDNDLIAATARLLIWCIDNGYVKGMDQ